MAGYDYSVTKRVHGRDWYFYLHSERDKFGRRTTPLFNSHRRHICATKILLCFISHRDGKTRHYSVFDTTEEVYEYVFDEKKFLEDYRSFFEVILGETKQKPKFDIDIDSDTVFAGRIKKEVSDKILSSVSESKSPAHPGPVDRSPSIHPGPIVPPQLSPTELDEIAKGLQEDLIGAIKQYFTDHKEEINISNDIRLYYSHGASKRSIHLTMPRKYHNNNVEAKEFYDGVYQRMTHEYKHCVDASVYKGVQQFRLYGSQKHGSGRIKVLPEGFTFEGKVHYQPRRARYDEFVESLISIVPSDSMHVPVTIKLIPKVIVTGTGGVGGKSFPINREIADECLNLCPEVADSFVLNDIKDDFILLKRKRPSYCRQCCRRHDNENAFITVTSRGVVMYHCRRSFTGYLSLGYLPSYIKGEYSVSMDEVSDDLGDEMIFTFGKITIKVDKDGNQTRIDGDSEGEPPYSPSSDEGTPSSPKRESPKLTIASPEREPPTVDRQAIEKMLAENGIQTPKAKKEKKTKEMDDIFGKILSLSSKVVDYGVVSQ